MIRFLFSLILVLSGYAISFAQTKIVDDATKLPVVNAIVYDSCGVVVDSSDKDGVVKLKNGNKYSISHLGYEPCYVDRYDGKSSIRLVPASYGLKNVTVGAKKKKYYYVRLYYRSIEDVNSCLKYYSEGIADFIVDCKNSKVKRVACYGRNLVMDSLVKLDIKKSFSLRDDYTGLPYLESKTCYEDILLSRKKSIDSDGNVMYEDHKIGTYIKQINSKEAIVSIDELFPKSQLNVNLFGFNQVLSKNQYVEVYHDNNLDEHTVYDIKALSRYRHLTLKHKSEAVAKDINVRGEAFVICSEYSDNKDTTSFPKVTKEYIDSCRTNYPLETVILDQLPKMQRKL